MSNAIFLSASVPDPRRSPEYAATADSIAIASAVSALVYVTIGRRPLVWGGHPAITPMVWVVAEDFGIEYSEWVTLYQTDFFKEDYPEINEKFQNVVHTPNINNSRDESLLLMRERMFKEHTFDAAIFIGGMKGIVDEYDLFHKHQPNARALPVPSTGGASIDIADRVGLIDADLRYDLDYVSLFYRHLTIPANEQRYVHVAHQPRESKDRLWLPTISKT